MSIEGPAAEAIAPTAANQAPALLKGRYEVGERVSEGAFFQTHRGRDLESGKPVALKVLKAEFASDEAFTERLLTEAQSAIGLSHQNIAQVYEAWAEYGTVLIISEWVRGINLKDRIRRVAPFPLGVAVDIFQACAEGLQYAHTTGQIHGDLRPENVIITPDGRVKLTDFGVGVSSSGSNRIQLGTLSQVGYYLAPELVEGKPPVPQTDLYALGCIFYEMLCGYPPFDAETPLALAVKHVHEPPPSVRMVQSSVPAAVDGIVRKCMQKAIAARYTGAAELLADVKRLQDDLRADRTPAWSPLPEDPAPPPTRSRRAAAETPIEAPLVVRAAPATREAAPVERTRRREAAPVMREDTGPSWKLLFGMALIAILMIAGAFSFVAFWTRPPDTVTVPTNLVGLSKEAATEALQRLGLTPDFKEQFNKKVEEGKVYEVEPRPGMDIRVGKSVILHVSRGTEPITVPDVSGKALADARKQIQGAGLSIGQTREEFSEVVEKGQVISQAPLGSTEASKKTNIDLVVSKGPEPISDPQPVDVTPNTNDETADGDDPARTPDPPAPDQPAEDLPSREFDVEVQMPRRAEGFQKVEIRVRNEDGQEHVAYEGDHDPGEKVTQTVLVVGREGKCRVRVFLNGRLIRRMDL